MGLFSNSLIIKLFKPYDEKACHVASITMMCFVAHKMLRLVLIGISANESVNYVAIVVKKRCCHPY